jgi:4-alpha-glucanotransferase
MKTVYALHEHDLLPSANKRDYEAKVGEAIKKLRVDGLLNAYHLKGFKGERQGKYAVLWIFASEEAIVQNFGTPENPKWPEEWLHYENEVLAPFIDRHPDKINFSDYHVVAAVEY